MHAIIAEKLNKSYAKQHAVQDISFTVDYGEIFGLIGPDGAGKTTLFRLLTTLMNPDSGQGRVLDLDIVKDYKKIRSLIGYMPGRFSLYQDLTVEENLNFFATLFGMTIEESYHFIAPIYKQIEPFKRRLAGKLSGGMKQKLALCCALIHQPKVLMLDEPTTGVDVVSRTEFWDMLADLKKHGMAILVSTPYMDEASRCDKIALINEGKILDINTPQAMISAYSKPLYSVSANEIYPLLLHTRQYESVESIYSFGDVCHLSAKDNFDILQYTEYMRRAGFSDIIVTPISPTVEDIFINRSRS